MKLLLDAHILLWVLYEPERLAERTRNAITDESNELFVSLATLWEIVNKAATHRLPLAGSSLERIVERIEELGGLSAHSAIGDCCCRDASTPPRRPVRPHSHSAGKSLCANPCDSGCGYDAVRRDNPLRQALQVEERELEQMRMEGEQEEMTAE